MSWAVEDDSLLGETTCMAVDVFANHGSDWAVVNSQLIACRPSKISRPTRPHRGKVSNFNTNFSMPINTAYSAKMKRQSSPRFNLAIIGVFLLFIFPHQIEKFFSVLYVVVLAALTGMIILHHGADLCKEIARRLWEWGLELVFWFLLSIPQRLVACVPAKWSQLIVDRWNGFLGKVHAITAVIANDFRQMVIETTVVLIWVFHAVAKWFGWETQTNDDREDAFSRDSYRWRIVFIVSVKFGRSYDATKTALAELDDLAPFIDWEGIKLDMLPEPSSFVRHFAICAIPLEDWNKEGLTLTSKFCSGIFWEFVGPDYRLLFLVIWLGISG